MMKMIFSMTVLLTLAGCMQPVAGTGADGSSDAIAPDHWTMDDPEVEYRRAARSTHPDAKAPGDDRANLEVDKKTPVSDSVSTADLDELFKDAPVPSNDELAGKRVHNPGPQVLPISKNPSQDFKSSKPLSASTGAVVLQKPIKIPSTSELAIPSVTGMSRATELLIYKEENSKRAQALARYNQQKVAQAKTLPSAKPVAKSVENEVSAPSGVQVELKMDSKPIVRIENRVAKPAQKTDQPFSIGVPSKDQIQENGTVTATVYFIAILNEDTPDCKSNEMVRMYLGVGSKSIMVCPKTLSFCSEQGSCILKQNNAWTTYNVVQHVRGHVRFAKVTDSCVYGYGVRGVCLDPFYSVAAELSANRYKLGDVIFIPALRGQLLPNGQKHDGYLVVRDKGSDIKGKGRFDFFSGSMNWKHAGNPFTRLNLQDKNTDLEYSKVSEAIAERVRRKRGYPKLPGHGLVETALANGNTAGVPTSL